MTSAVEHPAHATGEQTRSARRVAITGVGAVTPLGVGALELFERLCAGESGVRDGIGRCWDFDAGEHLSRQAVRRNDRFAHFALVAAGQAVGQAGWDAEEPAGARDRVGVVLGTVLGGIATLLRGYDAFVAGRAGSISPLTPPLSMHNAAAGAIAMAWGLRGPAVAVASACASGTDAIGLAARAIRRGDADGMLAGGSDACALPYFLAGFETMGALSPSGVARPFDARRDGFVMGEGAAIFALEELGHARRRGAPVLGEVLGYGSSNDAFHLTNPDEEGAAAANAMRGALQDAGVDPAEVVYVNAHGGSTPIGDLVETRAIEAALGAHARHVRVSSTKPATGHLMGGAGAVEALATLLALRHGTVPPTVGLEQRDPQLDLDYVALEAAPLPAARRRVGLKNSFGLGGCNATLCLSAPADEGAA